MTDQRFQPYSARDVIAARSPTGPSAWSHFRAFLLTRIDGAWEFYDTTLQSGDVTANVLLLGQDVLVSATRWSVTTNKNQLNNVKMQDSRSCTCVPDWPTATLRLPLAAEVAPGQAATAEIPTWGGQPFSGYPVVVEIPEAAPTSPVYVMFDAQFRAGAVEGPQCFTGPDGLVDFADPPKNGQRIPVILDVDAVDFVTTQINDQLEIVLDEGLTVLVVCGFYSIVPPPEP